MVLLALAASGPLAEAQPSWPDADLRAGRLSFDGKATLGAFTGSTDSVRGRMVGGPSLRGVRGWVEAPVRALKTGNNRRDRDLYKAMEADIYPTIRFQLESVEPQWERSDSASAVLTGQFFIHGVNRPERIPALVSRTPEGIRVTASLPMDLRHYQIEGLTRFLIFKMKPEIVVHVDVMFGY